MGPGLDPSQEAAVLAVLEKVPDPEIPVVSIVDLGMVRGVRSSPPAVLLTPTYSGCPATSAIKTSVRSALDGAGFGDVAVEMVLAPAWTTDWISEQGRARLLDYGVAPPPPGAAAASLRAQPVACPRCASQDTVEVSRFGSTPCKALWRCQACAEPFDRFKCH